MTREADACDDGPETVSATRALVLASVYEGRALWVEVCEEPDAMLGVDLAATGVIATQPRYGTP